MDDKDIFTSYISSPCKYGEQIGIARLQLVMRCCTLRRTKESTHEDGSKILNLPPRSERQMWLTLREDERKIYDERANKAKDKFGELKANNEVSKMYVNMLQEVLRLRQICNHVDLAMEGPVEEDYDGTVMDYEVAVQGIERNGLTQSRAVAVVCSMKEGEGATCTSCGLDFGDWFPWVGLGGVEEEKEKPKVKKMPTKPLLTKCLHLYCESYSVRAFFKLADTSYRSSMLQSSSLPRIFKAHEGHSCAILSLLQHDDPSTERRH